MNKPLVSILITCFNKEPYIQETIDSALAQTYENIEIIIVNDGSTDNSARVIDQNTDPRIKKIHSGNQGVARARNTAASLSGGEIILPLDGDDILMPEYTAKAVEIMEQNPLAGIVYCQAEKFGNEMGRWQLEPYSFERILLTNMIHVSAFIRKKDFEKTPGWNPNMKFSLEDWDLYLSLIEQGVQVFMIPEVLFRYRILQNSRTRISGPEETREGLRQIYLNHIDLYAKHFADPLNLSREIHELKKVKHEYELVINSISFKIGKTLTAPARLLRDILRK
jgi:glycosyltransferase involved in cell wall biosynthesis